MNHAQLLRLKSQLETVLQKADIRLRQPRHPSVQLPMPMASINHLKLSLEYFAILYARQMTGPTENFPPKNIFKTGIVFKSGNIGVLSPVALSLHLTKTQ